MDGLTRRSFIAATAVGAVAVLAAGPERAFADPTSAELQAQVDEAKTQLEGYQEQLDIASDNYYTAMDEHDAAVEAMNEAQDRIDAANAKLATLQDHLSTRATQMYKSGPSSMVDVLLGADSFEDFATTWTFLQSMNEDDVANIDETDQVRAEAQAAHDEYAAQEQIAADKLVEAETAQEQAQELVDQCSAEIDSLSAQVQEALDKEQAAAASGVVTPAGANTIVAAAYSQLGVPYVWGGTSPGVGLDCSGLVQYCYACAGISLPRVSQDQRAAGTRISISDAQPGDILGNSHHVAIYIGGGQFIHAPYTGTVVQIGSNTGQFEDATHIG